MVSAGQLISERVMLKRDRFFAVSARGGSMRPSEFLGDGLWDGDTRILSELRVLINGVEPTAVTSRNDDASATFELEAGGLCVTRVRFVEPAPVLATKTVDGVRLDTTRVITFPEGLSHQLRLPPGGDFSIRVDVVPDDGRPVVDFVVGLEEANALYPRWADECMAVETDNPALNELLSQALDDIRMLCNRFDT